MTGDCYQRWSQALNQWIRQNYKAEMFGVPSWRTLLKAIAEVDKRKFKKLAEDHQREFIIAYRDWRLRLKLCSYFYIGMLVNH